MRLFKVCFLSLFIISGFSCEFSKKAYNKTSDAVSNANVFPYTDDITLGAQVAEGINSNNQEYPILNPSTNKEIYAYLEKLKRIILNSGKIKYKTQFAWELKIIDDDKTLNAFATPGGYIYIYTGLIKFLDSEDQLLGVLGHEMAHADRRHSTRQLTKSYGISILLDAVLGKQDAVEQIVGAVAGLKFSRSNESEADEYSVIYLCNSGYNSAGAAGFFEKMAGQPSPPEFLSTHPNPANRVQDIHKESAALGCKGSKTNTSAYEKIKKLI